MSTTYLCKKCNIRKEHYNDLKKHLYKKKQCSKNLDAFNYSEDQIIILTLLPYFDNKHIVNDQELEIFKSSTELFKNKDKLFNILETIDKTKTKKCLYCDKEFSKNIDLRKHILLSCFLKELEKNNDNNLNKGVSIVSNSNNINIGNIGNISNITNIYVNIKNPVPFDEDWDISKIDLEKKTNLLFSKIMYTKLLEEILKNDINLNVIIDKDNDSGMVYKNDIDQYIQMKLKDIIDNSMDKLKKHLLNINELSSDICLDDCLLPSKNIIEKKHSEYKTNMKIQKIVNELVANIYETKKNDAINISNNISNSDSDRTVKGF
jgi:hypothetical protein